MVTKLFSIPLRQQHPRTEMFSLYLWIHRRLQKQCQVIPFLILFLVSASSKGNWLIWQTITPFILSYTLPVKQNALQIIEHLSNAIPLSIVQKICALVTISPPSPYPKALYCCPCRYIYCNQTQHFSNWAKLVDGSWVNWLGVFPLPLEPSWSVTFRSRYQRHASLHSP